MRGAAAAAAAAAAVPAACVKLSTLRTAEQDRRERSEALLQNISNLVTAAVELVDQRVSELDRIVSDLEATVDAQRAYDAVTTQVVPLLEQSSSEPPPSEARVNFPALSPGPAPTRRVAFTHGTVSPSTDDKSSSSPYTGRSADPPTSKSTCYTPFTPAPFSAAQDEDEEELEDEETGGGGGRRLKIASPDKLSRGEAQPQQNLPGKLNSNKLGGKLGGLNHKVQLADLMEFQPLMDASTFSHAHGPAVVAVFECLRLLQTRLAAAVAAVDKNVLPDLRTLRVNYFRCGERARAVHAQQLRLAGAMADCVRGYQRIVDRHADRSDRSVDRSAAESATESTTSVSMSDPFFESVQSLQSAQARLLRETLDLAQRLSNIETSASETNGRIGTYWRAALPAALATLQDQLGQLLPAFAQSNASNNKKMPETHDFAPFPMAAAVQTDNNLTPCNSLEDLAAAAGSPPPLLGDVAAALGGDPRTSPRWTPDRAAAVDNSSQARPDEEAAVTDDDEFAANGSFETAPNAPLCGRSVRALHRSFKPLAIPFWSAADGDCEAVAAARIASIVGAVRPTNFARRATSHATEAEWRGVRAWLDGAAAGRREPLDAKLRPDNALGRLVDLFEGRRGAGVSAPPPTCV